MSKTVKGLLRHCRGAIKNDVQYVYGAKMEILTYRQIKTLQDMYGKSYVWDSDLDKAGKLCCDCSGLISSYTGILRNSSNYANTATESGTIEQLKADWSNYAGWGIWHTGHIGVVSDMEGYYYAMDGSSRNMVHYPLSKNSWTRVIKLCDIDYKVNSAEITTYDEAVRTLVAYGVITSREYWDYAVKCVKYLDTLIINMANML